MFRARNIARNYRGILDDTGLLTTCRQSRHEILPLMLYQVHTVRIHRHQAELYLSSILGAAIPSLLIPARPAFTIAIDI